MPLIWESVTRQFSTRLRSSKMAVLSGTPCRTLTGMAFTGRTNSLEQLEPHCDRMILWWWRNNRETHSPKYVQKYLRWLYLLLIFANQRHRSHSFTHNSRVDREACSLESCDRSIRLRDLVHGCSSGNRGHLRSAGWGGLSVLHSGLHWLQCCRLGLQKRLPRCLKLRLDRVENSGRCRGRT